MKNRRRLLLNLVRIALSVAFLYWAYSLIHFKDILVRIDGKLTLAPQEIQEERDSFRIRIDGAEQRLSNKEWERREGFLSLFRRMDRRIYFTVAPLFLLPIFLCALRWLFLLRASGFSVRLRSVFAVTYMGGFFNNFLPGSVGGDIARAMIAGKGEERKAALVGTVLLDRLIGLGTMVFMAAVCIIPFVRDVEMRLPVLIIGSMLTGAFVFYLAYFSRTLRRIGWVQGIKNHPKIGKFLQDLDGTLKLAKQRKDVIVACVLLSLVAQTIAIVATFVLARALGISQVRVMQFLIFEPIIFIVSAVPISAGAWGVQEWIFQLLFGRVGVPANQAIAISILYRLTLIFVSLPGGILFALGTARRRREGRARIEVDRSPRDVPAHR